ncbi:MAG: DUF1015 domain-containing protein [Gammaproteobacteria bacterium]|nr:DUF1015 domain-containing protein [Gammaproteobacteria bacterium]
MTASLIRPFAALRPSAERAAEVAAPPYDVLSSEEARERAAGKPWSFLHVSKPEIDLPPETDPHAPAVYAKGAENLARMRSAGVLLRDPVPGYYVYRLAMGTHVQTGLAVAASVAAYDTNRIRKHEFTRPDKEDDRVRNIEALNAETGPVLLAYPESPEIDALIAGVSAGEPEFDLVADTGVRHTVWKADDFAIIEAFTRAFEALPALYIADGHHRSAAASRVAAARRAAGAGPGASHEAFLAVAFPHHEMQILPYNRLVADLNGLSVEAFLDAVAEKFDVSSAAAAVAPALPGEFGMLLGAQWYRLAIKANFVPAGDPVARLDVSLLADHLLAPVLGIADPRRDERIDFVGGIRGLAELERRVAGGEAVLAFSMFPTRMADLMAVADALEVMPPKSTWFEPKLADGPLSHVLD